METQALCLNHELKNPLYIIRSKIETHLDWIERGLYQSSEEEAMKSRDIFLGIARETNRVMDIIRKNAHVLSRRVEDEKRIPVSVCETVNMALQKVLSECSNKNMSCVRINQDSLGGNYVLAHPTHLEEIFFNLMINAFHALQKKGGGELRIRTFKLSSGMIRISFSDSGPGIPKKVFDRIFDPFYTTKANGTGLGLFIVKYLVERFGGRIQAKTQRGKGSSFILDLPAAISSSTESTISPNNTVSS